ncbi:hypothetical protein [Azohydromonas lata]|uniref:Rad50/SbcC-type AAA domain-containing protein n=1 Tax=Azohydromonas lata TaxID=45677 RepID=A0ABU5IAE3_9BURK|nr:hypothetical protein [Azohydromonas lata]MDZ5456076.1 hypothetical protein [Azohydromonas lata]
MKNKTYLFIERLILKGIRKNYEATFTEGLNVVWGDMDSGKSSILNLIDYCFGGSNEQLQYAEIAANVRVVFLQVDLNGNRVTIERDLADANGPIRVYSGTFEEVSTLFPRHMSASPSVHMPDGWLSDFVLECLNIPKVKIRESKKEDASADRLSIRDLLKLMYLKQTRVGSDNLLDYANQPLFVKNVEVQKFVFNVHNEALTTLKGQLSLEVQERNALLGERNVVLRFLESVNLESSDQEEALDKRIAEKDEEIAFLEHTINELKRDFKLSSSFAVELKTQITDLQFQQKKIVNRIREIEEKRNSYVKLKETYDFDLENLELAKRSKSLIGDIPRTIKPVSCPLCETPLSLSPNRIGVDDISVHIRSIKNRMAGVGEALTQLLQEQGELQSAEIEINRTLKEKITAFDGENFADVSGLVQSIETMEKARSELQVKAAALKQSISIHRRFADIDRSIENKAATIESIRLAIQDVESGVTDIEKVVDELSGFLARYMESSGLRNVYNVYVDKKFVPHFRGLSYYKATSGGVRTVLSIGSYIARLQYLIHEGGNLPPFLMIDTPGQNIGHTRRADENGMDDEVSDPIVYEKVYEQILNVALMARLLDRFCQVIVVDNDLPEKFQLPGNFNLVKRFSKNSKIYPPGLIDDINTV